PRNDLAAFGPALPQVPPRKDSQGTDMKTALRRLGAAAAAFALSACMLTGGDTLVTPGGAEDFPNTVNTLARIAAEDIAAGGQWEQAQAVQLPELPDLGGFD